MSTRSFFCRGRPSEIIETALRVDLAATRIGIKIFLSARTNFFRDVNCYSTKLLNRILYETPKSLHMKVIFLKLGYNSIFYILNYLLYILIIFY